jgi:hypothetical protein
MSLESQSCSRRAMGIKSAKDVPVAKKVFLILANSISVPAIRGPSV